MSINHSVFFPCAGFGTRMGEVGKELPKPLWPLFSSNLLEISINYARTLHLENYYINVHHKKEELVKWAGAYKFQINVSEEAEILGSGGCFHRLMRTYPQLDDLFIFNPDSILMLSKRDWENFFRLSSESKHVLIGVGCDPNDKYNRLNIKNNFLESIQPPSSKAPAITYSGFGKVSLKSIKVKEGVSGFFETVVIPGASGAVVFIAQDPYEFWDFGTLESYKENVVRLLSEEETSFKKFLVDYGHLDSSDSQKNTYASKNPGVINFTGAELTKEDPGIYLKVGNDLKRLMP